MFNCCSRDENGAMFGAISIRRPCGFARLWWGPAGFAFIVFFAIVSPKPGGHFPQPGGGACWANISFAPPSADPASTQKYLTSRERCVADGGGGNS